MLKILKKNEGVSYNRLGWLHFSYKNKLPKENLVSNIQMVKPEWRYQIKNEYYDGEELKLTLKSLLIMGLN
jgi:hypothetical protein